jgi:hypothetical protein
MKQAPPLTGNLAIIQGESYSQLELSFPGNLTAWEPRGQIRTALLEDGGELLADFSFAPASYDAGTNTTTIYPRLSFAQTRALPSKGKKYYDIEVVSAGGEVVKLAPAMVEVVGTVTG